MNLVSNINELDYYNTPDQWDCYCEYLAYPSDLVLQDSINTLASSGFSLSVFVMSADGLTTYEDATSYFSWYIFQVNNTRLFNLRLNSYSPAMCQYLCWILRIEITIGGVKRYVKYTNRYCQTVCCDIPRSVTFGSEEFDTLSQGEISQIPQSVCGNPLIRIQVDFPCLDYQLGEYYGSPTNVLQGIGSFKFSKITNITGEIKQKPRSIDRIISYNCTLQRSESFKIYNLQTIGTAGTFPKWKLNEFEGMFHAPVISVSDFYETKTYQFQGGEIAVVPHDCWEIYRLNATLQSCTVRQTFGCSEDCVNANSLTFLIPLNATGNNFYSESNTLIGDYNDLIDYYSGYGEVTDETYENTYNSFSVTSDSYIPTNFYYDSLSLRNRVFGTSNPIAPVIGCEMPVIGTIENYALSCQTPELGTEETFDSDLRQADIANLAGWTVEPTSIVDLSDRYARMNLETSNVVVIETSPLTYLTNEPIGKIEPNGVPSFTQTFSNSDNESIPIDSYVTIDTFGTISYSGYPTSYDGEAATITITNLYYLL